MSNSINHNGVSTCKIGIENYTTFNLCPRPRRRSLYYQYDFRDPQHGLFSTVAPTLEQCRAKRDEWLKNISCN